MNSNSRINFSEIKAPGMFHVGGWLLLLGCSILLWRSIPGVFPETIDIARGALCIGLLGASLLIGLTCYGVGPAKKLAGVLGIACTLTMIANVSSHWLMARALNVAHVYEIQKREEEDHEDKRADAAADRSVKILNAEAGYNQSVARADSAAATLYRQTGIKPPAKRNPKSDKGEVASLTPTPQPTVAPPAVDKFGNPPANEEPQYQTRKQVFASWAWICSALGILDLLLPVGGVAFCIFRWELDLNRDGIADRLQATPGK